jgi:hypothetical protein
MVAIKTLDAEAMGGPDLGEMAMLEGTIEVIALVGWAIVTIPVVVVDVRSAVDVAFLALLLRSCLRLALRGWRRYMSLIRARRTLIMLRVFLGMFL